MTRLHATRKSSPRPPQLEKSPCVAMKTKCSHKERNQRRKRTPYNQPSQNPKDQSTQDCHRPWSRFCLGLCTRGPPLDTGRVNLVEGKKFFLWDLTGNKHLFSHRTPPLLGSFPNIINGVASSLPFWGLPGVHVFDTSPRIHFFHLVLHVLGLSRLLQNGNNIQVKKRVFCLEERNINGL